LGGAVNSNAFNIKSAIFDGARVAFISGNFNIVHPGHLRLLKFADDMADILVVGLNPDGSPGVSVPGSMRLEGIQALRIVKHAFILDCDLGEFISQLRPDYVVKGKEFESKFNLEAAAVERYGGKLVFSSGDASFVAVDLLRQEFLRTTPLPLLRGAEGFPERHGLAKSTVRTVLEKMAGIRVAVVGDIIVDEYVICDPLGMSREDPTIVVSPVETETYLGGAAMVSAHARRLGAETHLFSVFGDDSTADYARASLQNMGVTAHGIMDDTRPTTRKQRYRALDKTLLRVNHLRQHAISKQIAERILDEIVAVLPKIDLLMFSDFNYGCLPQDLVDAIATAARAQGVLMTADSQASSQISDITRFKGMTLITPTEHEARLALRDTASGLAVLTTNLREIAAAENVLVTLGDDGMMVYGRDDNGDHTTDRLPALNPTPKDVTGAGDCVFAIASMALCSNADIWHAAFLGSIGAALQISRLGNRPLDVKDILFELDRTDCPQEIAAPVENPRIA
jgi:rfaE bifunctional protein kinase chain/domain